MQDVSNCPSNVADPGCLSWILIFIHPGSYNSNKRGVCKLCCPTSSLNLKLLYFWSGKENNLSQFSKKCSTFFPKKLSLRSQKYGFRIREPRSGIRDPGSEIRDPRSGIRDPGSEIWDPDPGSKCNGSRIRICNTVSFYCMNLLYIAIACGEGITIPNTH